MARPQHAAESKAKAATPKTAPKRSAGTGVPASNIFSLFGAPPSDPFAGVRGSNAPAKTTKLPDLTARVALARARQQRLKQGGLLTAPQQRSEQKAAAKIPAVSGLLPSYTPPPSRYTTPAAVPRETPAAPAAAPGRRVSPREQLQAKQPGQGSLSDILVALKGPAIGRSAAASILAPAAKYSDIAAGTGFRDTIAKFTGVGGPSIVEDFLHPTKALNESRKLGWQTSSQAAAGISDEGMKVPNLLIPISALAGARKLANGGFSFGGTAYAAGAKVPFADIRSVTGWDVTPQYGKALNKSALKRGWNPSDLENISATQRIFMAYNDPPSLPLRLLKGVAQNVIQGGSQTVGFVGLGNEIAQGRGMSAAGNLFDFGRNLVPGLGNHPWLQNAETNPLFAATAAAAALKSAGAIGHLRPGIPGDRIVQLKGVLDTEGNKLSVNRGPVNKNLSVAAGNYIQDLRAATSGRAAGHIWKQATDTAVFNMRDLHAHEHMALQVPHKVALQQLKKDRATTLMAWKDFGGVPGLQNGIAHFTREAAAGNEAAGRLIPKLQDALDHPPSTAVEHAYVESLAALSEHTSNLRQERGLHGAIAQLYRKYETPIEMAASAGDPVAKAAKAARDEFHNLRESDPLRFSVALHSKVTEIGRDVKRHTKKAEATAKRVEDQTAALKAWREKDAEIRARRPALEPATDVLSTHDTLKGASAAAAKATERVKVEKQGEKFVVRSENAQRRPAGTMGPHRAAIKKWKAEKAAHDALKPPKPTGVSRAGGKVEAHTTEVRQQSKRLSSLTQKQRDALPYDQRVQMARRDYEQATQAFVDQHAAAGGTEPAYVERSKPPSGVLHPSRLAGKQRFTPKMQREHTSSGHSITSGQFVYDTRSPLHANAEMQRIRSHIDIYNHLSKHPAVEHVRGDGKMLVPKGKVAVPESNYRSAAVTVPAWNDQVPVNMHDLQREHGIREKFAAALGNHSTVAGEVIPAGQDVALLPKAMHDRIVEWAKPRSKDGAIAAYERMNAAYQRLLIGIYPSTLLGNTLGSFPLALAAGALHPSHWYLGLKSGKKGPLTRVAGMQKTPEIAPAQLSGLGAGGTTRPPGGNWLDRTVGKGREASMLGEDYTSRVAYFAHARAYVEGSLPVVRKLFPQVDKLIPEKYKGLAHKMNTDATTIYEALAKGTFENGKPLPPEIQRARERLIDRAKSFAGASAKPQGSLGRAIGGAILFHTWLGHILKLTLITLPVSHPRRALLLDAVSQYGNQYRQEHGVYPAWMLQFFPLLRYQQAIGGRLTPGVLSVGLGQLTPMASATNIGQAGSALDTLAPSDIAASIASPLLQPFIKAGAALQHNAGLKPGEARQDPFGIFTSGAFYAIPGIAKFFPRAGHTPDYIPGVQGGRKQYYNYVAQPGGKSYKRYKIPYAARPGGRPEGGFVGDASRVLGLPLERNFTGGRPLATEHTNSNTFNWIDSVKRGR